MQHEDPGHRGEGRSDRAPPSPLDRGRLGEAIPVTRRRGLRNQRASKDLVARSLGVRKAVPSDFTLKDAPYAGSSRHGLPPFAVGASVEAPAFVAEGEPKHRRVQGDHLLLAGPRQGDVADLIERLGALGNRFPC